MAGYETLHGDEGVIMGDVTEGRNTRNDNAVRDGLARLLAVFPNFSAAEVKDRAYQNHFVYKVTSGIVGESDKQSISKSVPGAIVEGSASGTVIRIPRSIVNTFSGMLPSGASPGAETRAPAGTGTVAVQGGAPSRSPDSAKPAALPLQSVVGVVISILLLFVWMFYFDLAT